MVDRGTQELLDRLLLEIISAPRNARIAKFKKNINQIQRENLNLSSFFFA